MRKKLVLWIEIFIIVIMIFPCVILASKQSEVQEKTQIISKNENIVFLGDSIFDWFPVDKIFSDFPIVNSGIAGNTTNDLLKDLENRVYRYNPTKVFVQIGTNDIEWDDSDELNEQVFNNIVEITKQIQKNRKRSKIYIISIYPVNNNLPGAHDRHNSEIKAINSMLRKYCAETNGVEYIDAFNQLTGEDGMLDTDYTDDGLHPNGLGYAKLTEILMKYIYE